ncbi:hypothetical protein K466DRAFT_513194, partial [Polyporus arcularius HHB13444]
MKTVFPEINGLGHDCYVHALKVSPDGRWLASADEDSVILWRTDDGSIVKDWNAPFFIELGFTSESRHLVIFCSDRLVVRDMEDPCMCESVTRVPLRREDSTGNTCVWSPDRTLCALSGWGAHSNRNVFHIRIYITETAKALSCYQLCSSGRGPAWSLCPTFSHDNRWLLFTCNYTEYASESVSWIWDIYSTAPPRKLMNHGTAVWRSIFNP